MAVFAKNKADEERFGRACQTDGRRSDYRFLLKLKPTKEYCPGAAASRRCYLKLKSKFWIALPRAPKAPYRETIRKKVKVQGRHKKQTGGHGQYGDVWIEFEPGTQEDLEFGEKIFGGAVPKNYFPAVEKGLLEAVQKGVLAGYPMVEVKATLVDGSYHPVDSSEIAFKLAAHAAYRAGIPQASPVLLEPVGYLKTTVPNDNTGDIMGDINKRRGRVLGMSPGESNMTCIEAEVPMAEMGIIR